MKSSVSGFGASDPVRVQGADGRAASASALKQVRVQGAAGSAGAGACPVFGWFSRFDVRLGVLVPAGVPVHTEKLGEKDTLVLESYTVPNKGDRLLWWDESDGRWREHIVEAVSVPLVGPCRVSCVSSLWELEQDYVQEKRFTSAGAQSMALSFVAGGRWAVQGAQGKSASLLFYHVDVLSALRRVESECGVELEAQIGVANDVVTRRVLYFASELGAWRGLRFEYGHNLVGATRKVLETPVYTALYGWGAGLPITDEGGTFRGGYTRKLSFADINGGVAWTGDEAAREAWGLWDSERKVKLHRFGEVTFSDEEDERNLLVRTKAALAACVAPKVRYEVSAELLENVAESVVGDGTGLAAGAGAARPRLGDIVMVLDTKGMGGGAVAAGLEGESCGGWRVQSRVVGRVRELGSGRPWQLTLDGETRIN